MSTKRTKPANTDSLLLSYIEANYAHQGDDGRWYLEVGNDYPIGRPIPGQSLRDALTWQFVEDSTA